MNRTVKSKGRTLPRLTDELIESGADLSAYFHDPRHAPALDLTPHKVGIDFPAWVVAALDREADRVGIARQALVKMWIVNRLEQLDSGTRP